MESDKEKLERLIRLFKEWQSLIHRIAELDQELSKDNISEIARLTERLTEISPTVSELANYIANTPLFVEFQKACGIKMKKP